MWDDCSWVGSTTINYKNCSHLKKNSSCALKIKLKSDTVCDFEEKIHFEKYDKREVGVSYGGFEGTFYPKEKVIVIASSEGSSISLDDLEFIIKILKEYKG